MKPSRVLLVVALAGVGAVAPGLASASAVAAPAAAPTQPSPPASPDGPRVHVDDQDFGVVTGDTWTARFMVDDPDGELGQAVAEAAAAAAATTAPVRSDAPTGSTSDSARRAPDSVEGAVTVAVHGRIDDRGELARVQQGDLSATTTEVSLPLDAVLSTDGGDHVLELAVPILRDRRNGALRIRRPGIYPVTVTVEVGDDELAQGMTMVQVLPEDPSGDPSLGIAVTAALTDPGPNPDAEARNLAREELEELLAFSDVSAAPFSLALPPSLAAVLADDDELREATRQALDHAELLAQPYLTFDPSSAVAVDRDGAFSAEVRRGEDALSRILPGVASSRAAWLVREPLSRDAAAMLRDPLGYRLLVVDQPTYETLPGNISTFLDASLAVDIDLGEGTAMQAAVVSPLGSLLGDAGVGGRTPTEAGVEILTQLLVNRDELGPELRRNVVLATAGYGVPDGAIVAAVDRLLDGNPEAHLATLSDLVGTTETMIVGTDPVTLQLPDRAGPDLSERVQRLDLVRVSAESAASMLPDGERRREWLTELDALLSTGYSDEDVDDSIDRITAEIDAVRSSVEPPEPFTFTLTGRESILRLNLRNTADEPRTVLVRAVSTKLRFPGGEQRVTLQPGVTEVAIPVQARANGTSSVEIQLLTPVFGQRIGPPTFLEARVNAISGLGQTITGIAVLLLVTWWFSHFRRRRRARLASMAVVDEFAPGSTVSPDAAEATAVRETVPSGDGLADRDSLPDP